jgi:hypothetical protein
MPNSNAKAPNWAEVRKKASKCHLYFLNEYVTPKRLLRIELERGGERCLWKAKTVLSKMEETKRFLERCWHIDAY